MKMAVASTTYHTECCVIQVSTAREAGVLVVARSFALAIVIMQVKFASSKPMRIPVLGNRAFGYLVNVSNQKESMCVSTLKSIRCGRREGENTRDQEFKDLDVTGVAMVPYELEAPGAMVPSVSSCRDEYLFCSRVNQEQSDKRVRSLPRRFPRDRRRKCHLACPRKSNSNRGFHMLCSQ